MSAVVAFGVGATDDVSVGAGNGSEERYVVAFGVGANDEVSVGAGMVYISKCLGNNTVIPKSNSFEVK